MASARKDALSNCTSYADDCVIIAENETIVQRTDPFPASSEDDPLLERLQHLSDGTVFLLAIAALALLAIGTVTAERYPLFLFDTGLSDIWRLRMNYTLLPFGFLYFVLMLPLFFRLGEGNFSNPLTWVVFGAPILPYVGVVLYLRQKGKLSERFKIE